MIINDKTTISFSIILTSIGLSAGFVGWLTVIYSENKANANSIRYLEKEIVELRQDVRSILKETGQIREDLAKATK